MFASEQYFQKQALLSESLPVRPWNYAQGQPLGWGDLKLIAGRTGWWENGWMDGGTDRWVDGRTITWTDRCVGQNSYLDKSIVKNKNILKN